MSTLDEDLRRFRSRAPAGLPPARTVSLGQEAFATAYERRPTGGITVGLRIPSEQDLRDIEDQATKAVVEAPMGQEVRVWNDLVLHMMLARCICDPNDSAQPHPSFRLPDDMIPRALTPQTIRYLYDEIERLQIEASPIWPEVTDEQMAELGQRLARGEALDGLDPVRAARCRRYLGLVYGELGGATE